MENSLRPLNLGVIKDKLFFSMILLVYKFANNDELNGLYHSRKTKSTQAYFSLTGKAIFFATSDCFFFELKLSKSFAVEFETMPLDFNPSPCYPIYKNRAWLLFFLTLVNLLVGI